MTQAKAGQTVKVHYTGTLKDGSEFDSSKGRDPLEFTLGAGQVIAGFDDAVTGMKIGDSKTVNIPSDEAYGPHESELLHSVGRDQIPEEIDLFVGARLQASGPQGPVNLVVAEVADDTVTLDANHPLAGQDLTFDLELVDVSGDA